MSEFSFEQIETPLGVLNLHVAYRTDCGFTMGGINDSSAYRKSEILQRIPGKFAEKRRNSLAGSFGASGISPPLIGIAGIDMVSKSSVQNSLKSSQASYSRKDASDPKLRGDSTIRLKNAGDTQSIASETPDMFRFTPPNLNMTPLPPSSAFGTPPFPQAYARASQSSPRLQTSTNVFTFPSSRPSISKNASTSLAFPTSTPPSLLFESTAFHTAEIKAFIQSVDSTHLKIESHLPVSRVHSVNLGFVPL